MAPFDVTITKTMEPDTTNKPGVMNRIHNLDSSISKRIMDSSWFMHTYEKKVAKGDRVEAGEVIAKVGNNGNSRLPHIHVGAWKD